MAVAELMHDFSLNNLDQFRMPPKIKQLPPKNIFCVYAPGVKVV